MGNGGDIWIPRVGLGLLGSLAALGIVGGLVLANNGHEVPPWLSGAIGQLAGNLGIIVLIVYKGSNGNGPPAAK